MKTNRLQFIDCLRGFAVVIMIVFHICYDINEISLQNRDWPYYPEIRFWQQCIVLSFILISGLSYRLMSHEKRLKQGLKLLVAGELITLCMHFFMPQEQIIFGIITFLGWAVLLSSLLDRLFCKYLKYIPLEMGMVACAIAFVLTYTVQTGILKLGPWVVTSWPDFLYEQNLYFLGFPDDAFFSTDYVPLLPHIFMYWLGCVGYRLIEMHKPQLLNYSFMPFLAILGRNSLVIYLIHQPILLGIILAFNR